MQDEWHLSWEAIWGAKLMAHPRARQAYPTELAAQLGMAMFASVLSDIEDVGLLKAAVTQCCATCEWLPTPAEIRMAAGALVAPRFPSPIEAWTNAIDEMKAAKTEQRPPRFDHPLVATVVKGLGGPYAILRSEHPGVERGQFFTEYRELVNRETEQARLIPQARELAGATVKELPVAAETRRPLPERLCFRCGAMFTSKTELPPGPVTCSACVEGQAAALLRRTAREGA